MASTTANQQAAAQPASPGLVKRLIIIVLIVLVAAGAAGAGVWFFMKKHTSEAPQAAAPAPLPAPVFFPMDSMTVNLQSDDGQQHYLRIGLTLKLADQKAVDKLTERMPEIRSRVLLALSAKKPEDLAPLDGKRALAKELAVLITQPTDKGEAPVQVEDVLFTEFVVQ